VQKTKTSHGHKGISGYCLTILPALNSFLIKSELVLNCFQLLLKLAEQNKVKLIWVPEHSGVEGNEKQTN
jgi:hypothetical protein